MDGIDEPEFDRASAVTLDGIVAAVVADDPCELADQPGVMSKQAAMTAARRISQPMLKAEAAGEPGPAPESLPAAAVQVSYETADKWFGAERSGEGIAPNRCVWLVTVQAEFKPRSVPPPVPGRPVRKTATFDHYTVIFDVASGLYLGVSAGTSAPNLITGEGEFLPQEK